MLNGRFAVPKLSPRRVRPIPQENVNLILPVLILNIVIVMSLQGSEELESTLRAFLYFLFMGQTTPILY